MAYTFDKDIDYSALIKQAMEAGAPKSEVSNLLGQRVAKASSDPSLSQYVNDDFNQSVLNYLGTSDTVQKSTPTYNSSPSYSGAYDKDINNIIGQIMGGGKFSYDPATDPMYKTLEGVYTKKGQQAMQDTLGAVSARTGGLASSYATSAGNQAYNSLMDQLAEQIPALRSQAYSEYQGDKNDMYSRLNALLGVDNQNYGRYRDTVSDNQWQQTFDTNKAQRDLENQRWDTQWGFQQQQYADSRGDANFSKAQTLIGMGFSTQEIADALGITPEQANNYAAMAQQIMKKQGTITGNGGGDGGGKPKLTAAQVNAAIKAGNTTPDVLAAYEYYYGEPYSGDTQEAPKLTAAQVSAAIKNGQTSEEVLSAYEYYYGEPYVPDFKSYDSAVNYAKRIGLDVQGMLTESRWNQGKHYNVDDPAMSYDTYGDYVHDYLVYAMSK